MALHHFTGLDWLMPMPRHVVAVQLAGAVNLLQARGGASRVKHVRAGDVTISRCGEPKRFRHAGENVVILLRLDPRLLDAVAVEECDGRTGRCDLQEIPGCADPALVAIGRRLLGNVGAGGRAARSGAEALAHDLATHLARHYGTAASPARPPSHLTPRNLRRALDFIDANLRDEISLEDMARALAMSAGHFAHAFKGSTGLAPHRFVIARRVELAKSLLRQTDLPITEIA